jgi:decaprenylphospho-beta-D-erythro-pentofuranosid-2-ulose 2-reductase
MTAILSPVLIIGASSDIGRALAHEYARRGASLVLAVRRVERLDPDLRDLGHRHGATARAVELDILDPAEREAFLVGLNEVPGTVVSVVGLLGDQKAAESDPEAARMIMETNYVAPALLLSALANRMAERGAGTIIGISSVAGDRGRATNYVYGSAKAGFTAFLSGLRNRLAGRGVQVMTVKPGFVATRMTRGLKLSKALTASSDQVAKAIVEAQLAGRTVIYILGRWRLIMLVIRLLPEPIFMRMKF